MQTTNELSSRRSRNHVGLASAQTLPTLAGAQPLSANAKGLSNRGQGLGLGVDFAAGDAGKMVAGYAGNGGELFDRDRLRGFIQKLEPGGLDSLA